MFARCTCAETRGAHRVVLNLEQAEVERVLGEVGCQQWRNNLPWSSLGPSCILLGCCSSTVFTVVFYCNVSTE